MSDGSTGYRAEIDGLRAVAVLPVILFHAGFEAFGGGFVGVDVFFVISGYLITGILLREIGEGRFSLIGFYERRARRILPALFTVMIACVPFAWLWMVPTQFKEFAQSLVATSLFASNVLFWQQSGYFELVAEEKPLLHTWSLAVEEQFYVLFPLFFLLALRFGRSPAFWSVAVVAFISLALSEFISHDHPDLNFYLAPTRAWELLAGSLCAFALHRREMPRNGPLALLGLALILFAVFQFDHETRFPSLYTLVPVLGTVLIILFAAGGTGVGALLSTRAFVGIGLISYSAYLWHQPLFAFARVRSDGAPDASLMLALAAASLALAALSWRYVEQPFRRRGAPVLRTRWRLFSAAAVVSAGFIAFGLYGHVHDGLDGRFAVTEIQRDYLETAVPSPLRDACHFSRAPYIEPDEACTFFDAPAEVAVLGDSHVVELAYALAEALEPQGAGVLQLSYGACSPRYGQADGTSCSAWTHEAVEHVIADEAIETVVVTYRIHSSLFGLHEGVYPALPDSRPRAFRRAALASYLNLVEALDDSGKEVVLVLQSPELPRPMEDLIFRYGNADEPIPGVPKAWWDERTAYLRERLEVPDSVIVVDPAEIFCDEAVCYAGEDGVSFYFDDDHISVSGARLVAEQVLDALDEAGP